MYIWCFRFKRYSLFLPPSLPQPQVLIHPVARKHWLDLAREAPASACVALADCLSQVPRSFFYCVFQKLTAT